MIDWTAIVEGVGLGGGIAMWLIKQHYRLSRTAGGLKSHESGCEKAWAEARASFDEIKAMITEQNERTLEHRDSMTKQLAAIQTDVEVLKENRRMRERQEDLR